MSRSPAASKGRSVTTWWATPARSSLREVRPCAPLTLGGGVAIRAGKDSPLTKVAGLGFESLDLGSLGDAEHLFEVGSCKVQVELPTLADPAVGELLTRRGYILRGYEDVLGQSLPSSFNPPTPGELDVRTVGDDEFDTWVEVAAAGWSEPDPEGVEPHESFSRDAIVQMFTQLRGAPNMTRYLALNGGTPVGAASVTVYGGVAFFTGAATPPEFRRRGVQTALTAQRLVDVAARGCDLAVVTTMPGSTSQANAMRQGFARLYSRAILVRAM